MYTTLLVPLDNSALAEHALPTAVSLAKAAGAKIELVYVHEPVPAVGYPDAPWNAARRSSEESYIRATATGIQAASGVPTEGVVVTGHPADAIRERAHAVGADLIVMTTHGRTGLSRAWLGSVADGIAQHASIPILLVRPTGNLNHAHVNPEALRSVLVPIDGSLAFETALEAPAALVRATHGKLVIIAIVPPVPLIIADLSLPYAAPSTIPDRAATEELVEEVSGRLASTVQRLIASGVSKIECQTVVNTSQAQAALDACHQHMMDTIAVPISGRGVSRLAVGSLSDHVLRASHLPLLFYPVRALGAAATRAHTEEHTSTIGV